jgi:hypothetical protein
MFKSGRSDGLLVTIWSSLDLARMAIAVAMRPLIRESG